MTRVVVLAGGERGGRAGGRAGGDRAGEELAAYPREGLLIQGRRVTI